MKKWTFVLAVLAVFSATQLYAEMPTNTPAASTVTAAHSAKKDKPAKEKPAKNASHKKGGKKKHHS